MNERIETLFILQKESARMSGEEVIIGSQLNMKENFLIINVKEKLS